jgi:hypothetical protein
VADETEEGVRVPGKHSVGRPVDFVARGSQSNGAFVVALEGGAVSVVHVAVRFNHNPLDRPEEIDKMRADEDVDLGKGDFRFPT